MLAAIAAKYRVFNRRPDSGTPGPASARPVPGERDSTVVEVLNVSAGAGLARIATWRLRDGGLDVVYYGNDPAAGTLDSTEVLVRRGAAEAGERVAKALGIGTVRASPDPSRLVDVTVRLGTDFRLPALAGNP